MAKELAKAKEFSRYLFRYRYFWAYLVRCDLINRYRRSKLGMIWTMLQPLLLTMIMAVVFGTVFNQNILEYAPYVLSGMIMWEFITGAVVGNGISFIASESYIRQINHPISIYTLKAALVSTINLAIAMIGLVIWSLFIQPSNTLLGLVSLPLTLVLLFPINWAVSTISSFIYTKFRDYPQIATLVMQIVWYLSPVFFQESMFQGHRLMHIWFQLNPITHVLNMTRKPFLYGRMPDWIDYAYLLVMGLVFTLIAIHMYRKEGKRIIFYL